MTKLSSSDGASKRGLEALLRLRELEHEKAKRKLLERRKEFAALEQELACIEDRRRGLLRRAKPEALEERIRLERLAERAFERRNQLRQLRGEIAALAEQYLAARAKLEAARGLRDKERRERLLAMERKREQFQCDAVSARSTRETREGKEVPWEELAD